MAFKSVLDPDTMYMHRHVKEENKVEFKKAIHKNSTINKKTGSFSIIKIDKVPEGDTIIPMILR